MSGRPRSACPLQPAGWWTPKNGAGGGVHSAARHHTYWRWPSISPKKEHNFMKCISLQKVHDCNFIESCRILISLMCGVNRWTRAIGESVQIQSDWSITERKKRLHICLHLVYLAPVQVLCHHH